MALPLTHDRLLTILRNEGVRFAEYPGWRDRERDDETGKAFGPVHLILNHHTVSRDSLRIVAETGYAGLPGPLAHIHLAKSGLATMCSGGRANHAGLMAVNAFVSFRDEKAMHPKPDQTTGTVDGNDCSYGVEAENLGDNVDMWPRAQYDALVRINAAICREYRWKGDSCAGHKETSIEGKIDPRGPVEGYGTRGRFDLTMGQLRADINERLAHPSSWSPGAATPPKPPTVEERLTLLEKTVKDQGARLAALESKGA